MHFPVEQWLKRARRRERSQFACRETKREIKNFHDVLERRGRGRNKMSHDVLPWTVRITSSPLIIDKIVEDALKTTDKNLQKNIYNIYIYIYIYIYIFMMAFRILYSNWNKLACKFHITVQCFHAMGQSSTCTTFRENVCMSP